MRTQGLGHLKVSGTLLGIEPGTSRLMAAALPLTTRSVTLLATFVCKKMLAIFVVIGTAANQLMSL